MLRIETNVKLPLVTCGYTIAAGITEIKGDKNEPGLLIVLNDIAKQFREGGGIFNITVVGEPLHT